MATKVATSANQLKSSQDLQRCFAEALAQVCQKSFAFVNFVHVTGRLAFNVDNDHVSHVSVSEIVKPAEFPSEDDSISYSSVKRSPSKPKAGVVPPIRIHKARKPSVQTTAGRKRGRPPKKSFIVEENWVADVVDVTKKGNEASIRHGIDIYEKEVNLETNSTEEDTSGLMEVEGAAEDSDGECDEVGEQDDADEDYAPENGEIGDGDDDGKDVQQVRRKRKGSSSNSRTSRSPRVKKTKQIFQCDRCSYSSPYQRVLAKHQLKHELEEPIATASGTEETAVLDEEVTSLKCEVNDGEDVKNIEVNTESESQKVNTTFFMSCEDGSQIQQEPEETSKDTEELKAEDNKFKCDQCSYETDHSGHYRDHMNRHKGIRPHKCDTCTKTFTTIDDLKRHLDIHNRSYECPLCSEVFESRELLKAHAKDEHGERGRLPMPTCKVCKKRVPTASALQKHMEEKHDNICSICGETFTHRASLKKHREENHPVENLTCNLCGKKCSTKGALRKHVHRHREGTSFPCDICGKTFTAQSTLYHHKRGMHSDSKPYKCEMCGKTFNFHHSLKLHVLGHNGLRPHKCDICEKTYLTATHLKSHIEAVHSDTKKFKCVICNKNFPYENSLRMHMMLHTGERPFLCNICGRGFVSRSALKTHEASHVSDKSFECDICHKMYKTDMLLRAHRRRHTTDGSRFMCDICGHTFMYKSNLEAHYTVHGEERRFACNVCGKSFKTHATLYSHKVVHKEDSPHSCNVCGKSFKSKERKLAHEKRHLGLKPFQCDMCNRCFPDKGGLSKHRKTVHAITKKFACPICAKTCARADNLRVHMRVHGDPNLLKMSHEELMIKTSGNEDENSSVLDQKMQMAHTMSTQNAELAATMVQNDPVEMQAPQMHLPTLVVSDQTMQPETPAPPPPLPTNHQLQTITIDASQLGLTATSHAPMHGASIQVTGMENTQPHAIVLAPAAEDEHKVDVPIAMTQSLTMLTPAQAIIQAPGSTLASQPSDYHAEVANAMLYMQYQTYLSAQGNVQPPQ